MWEYTTVLVNRQDSSDVPPALACLNGMGFRGWEAFSVTESSEDDAFTVWLKRKVNIENS
jgi:hypothetical protein